MEKQGGDQDVGANFLVVEHWGRARGRGQKSEQERFKLDTRNLLPQEDSKAVEQVAKQEYWVSEGFQDLAGQSCEKHGLLSTEILCLTSWGHL